MFYAFILIIEISIHFNRNGFWCLRLSSSTMVHSMHLHKAPAVVKIWKRHKQFKEQGYLHGPKVYDDTQEIVEKV